MTAPCLDSPTVQETRESTRVMSRRSLPRRLCAGVGVAFGAARPIISVPGYGYSRVVVVGSRAGSLPSRRYPAAHAARRSLWVRIIVDLVRCQSFGQCVYAAPTVFRF